MENLERSCVVLFQSDANEEALRIECALTGDGGLAVLQESDGPLTSWCFEETPHRVETFLGPDAVCCLLEYFHLDDLEQLPAMLRAEYVGYDAGLRIRELARRLGLNYVVREHAIAR